MTVLEEQIIKEFLDYSPVNLLPVGMIDGERIFSNEKIESLAKAWMKEAVPTKKISGAIEKAIDNRILYIGYANKRLSSFLIKQITNWTKHKLNVNTTHTLGWYSKESQKIAVVIDDSIGLTGKALRNIPSDVSHELIHYSAGRDIIKFYRTYHDKTLLPFYRHLLNFFDPKTSFEDPDISEVIKKLLIVSEKPGRPNVKVKDVFKVWFEFFSKYKDKKNAEERTLRLISVYMIYIMGESYPRKYNDAERVQSLILSAYQELKSSNDIMTNAGQEIFFPSEVICVLEQYNPSSKTVRFINSMRF